MSEVRVRAIEAVADAVRRARDRAIEPRRHERARAALEQVADVTRRHGAAAVAESLAAIEELLLRPVDPSAIAWNVFQLFETSDSEVDWTKWLAANLSPEKGAALSALVWRSLCDAIVRQGVEPRPVVPGERVATLDSWREARDVPLVRECVDRECHDAEHGRTDIEVRAPGIFVVLENKLDAGWHDGDGEPQAVRYRKIGLKHCAPTQQLGLVLLSKHRDFPLGEGCDDWVKITYEDLARALRRNLRATVGEATPAATLLALWPGLLTIAAIEQDLRGLDIARCCARARGGSWRSIRPLTDVISYLRDEEG